MALAISTKSVPGHFETKLTAIAKSGFDAIDLHSTDFRGFDGDVKTLHKQIKDQGLGVNAFLPDLNIEGHSGKQHQLAFDRLEQQFDIVCELGGDLILLSASSENEEKDQLSQIAEDLAEAAERAKKREIRIAYSALPWGGSVQDEFAAYDIITQINSSALGLGLSSFFLLAGGDQPAKIRDIDGKKIFHIALADAPDLGLDMRHLARHYRLFPGLGQLNLAGFVRMIVKSGYQGNWSLDEVNDINPHTDAMRAANDGYRALVSLLARASRAELNYDFSIPDLPSKIYPSGFEFIEFAAFDDDYERLTNMLSALRFRRERKHISKSVELWRQGAVNIVVNSDKNSFAENIYRQHGATICDLGLRVEDAEATVSRAQLLGTPEFSQKLGGGELDIPAIQGVGSSVIHFVDQKSELHRVWDIEFELCQHGEIFQPSGIRRIDHIAQTMRYEEMQSWALYYLSTFQMEQSPIVDVADPSGYIYSQALQSPEGEVRLNLNGTQTRETFAGAFLSNHSEAQVQHIAFLSDDIFETSNLLAEAGFERLKIPSSYYDDLKYRFDLDNEMLAALRKGNILYDRDEQGRTGEYFQIYCEPFFNGFFFEIVERRGGYQGYGAANAPIRIAAQAKLMSSPQTQTSFSKTGSHIEKKSQSKEKSDEQRKH